MRILEVVRVDNLWSILALSEGPGVCPDCGGVQPIGTAGMNVNSKTCRRKERA